MFVVSPSSRRPLYRLVLQPWAWGVSLFSYFLFFWLFHRPYGSTPSFFRSLDTLEYARKLQESMCRRDTESMAGVKNSGGGACGFPLSHYSSPLDNPNNERKPLAPPLHLFFRVSVAEKSWSGAWRFMGWSKLDIAISAAYSLRVALETLIQGDDSALAPPSLVNITILYDGLQGKDKQLDAWINIMTAIFTTASEKRGSGSTEVYLSHVPVTLRDTGNRGTNLLQFALLRKLDCARGITTGLLSDPVVYFVEDDYIHAPTALIELLEALTIPAIDGSSPPHFAMLYDHPDRSTFGKGDVAYGATTVYGLTRHHWRTVPSSTMTFAARCTTLGSVLPIMEDYAPRDQEMWHRLLMWSFAGLPLAQSSIRLVAPVPSLAIHATEKHFSLFSPPQFRLGGLSLTSWCGLATCLKEGVLGLLRKHSSRYLEYLLQKW